MRLTEAINYRTFFYTTSLSLSQFFFCFNFSDSIKLSPLALLRVFCLCPAPPRQHIQCAWTFFPLRDKRDTKRCYRRFIFAFLPRSDKLLAVILLSYDKKVDWESCDGRAHRWNPSDIFLLFLPADIKFYRRSIFISTGQRYTARLSFKQIWFSSPAPFLPSYRSGSSIIYSRLAAVDD